MPCMARIGIVMSTFNRPTALRAALLSVQGQTTADWRALVVGDCCTSQTEDVVRALADPRISYLNLPQRQGEQALPNTIGAALLDEPLIAFLNHDDLWLPDHLELGERALASSGSDLFLGSAAFAHHCAGSPDGNRPIFSEVNPPTRTLRDAFSKPFWLFEPISAWLLRREAWTQVGGFRRSSESYRLPLIDWLLRLAYLGGSVCSDESVSVLKVNTHHRRAQHQYETPAMDQHALLSLCQAKGTDAFRAMVTADLAASPAGGYLNRDPHECDLASATADEIAYLRSDRAWEEFLAMGFDAFLALASAAGVPRPYDALNPDGASG